MNMLLIYMLKASIYLSAFYLIYFILLSRDTSYSRNRAFILFSLALALILPCIRLHEIKPLDLHFFGKSLSEVFISGSAGQTGKSLSGLASITAPELFSLIYLAGLVVFGLKLLNDLFSLFLLILRQKNNDSRIILFHGLNTAGFSALGYVFINETLKPEEAKEIVKHEQNHLKRNHFIDIIFIGIIKAFQWFNPAIYLFNRSLRAIHEFQADQECLSSGIPVISYQSLLLNQVFRTGSFTLTNSFSNPSLIKKRMIMMTKKRTSSFASMKLLIVIPVTGFIFLFVSAFGKISPVTNQDNAPATTEITTEDADEVPFVMVDEMPLFPGGDAELLKYIAQNTVYPENAKKNQIQGRVIVRFCVTAKGSVNKISILKGVDPELDAEAVRVTKTLPAFKPGMQGGKAVPVWYMIPITFVLK